MTVATVRAAGAEGLMVAGVIVGADAVAHAAIADLAAVEAAAETAAATEARLRLYSSESRGNPPRLLCLCSQQGLGNWVIW